ncbi:MAG: phosphoribosylformylglycinamidine synthase subunit PurS [Proteobacteria bacterium]|nr:phosphoribosylformylglycinamidine synthase subunit PurS [Pseudomonadota bacterium]
MADYLARVRVTLKPTVNDPQGNTVAQALGTLGFDTVEEVRVGKFIEVKLTASSRVMSWRSRK